MYRYVEKNMLILDDTTFRFDFSIRQMEVLDDLTFILLAIPNQSSEIRNVYGYKHSNRIWQVEDLSIRYPNRKNLPFEKINILNGDHLIGLDFYGRRYQINAMTGMVISQISSTK